MVRNNQDFAGPLSWARVSAPVRVLDAGGWTDTWFAGEGLVCHLCVGPGAEARARREPCRSAGRPEVSLSVPDYGDRYTFAAGAPPGRHPLLEAALQRWAPGGSDLEVEVSCSVPGGSSLGTSASVVVALIKALHVLAGNEAERPALARAAHDIETVDLGRQSGVQDQVAAAYGGVNLVRVAPYPSFEVESLEVPRSTLEELSGRLFTVYLGAHDSSEVHTAVISRLEEGDAAGHRALGALREAAGTAATALVAGDLGAYGEAMTTATMSQAALHPMLVSDAAGAAVEVARRYGAVGWKVNGAGGAGGSVTFISGPDPEGLARALAAAPGMTVLPLRPCPEGAAVVAAG